MEVPAFSSRLEIRRSSPQRSVNYWTIQKWAAGWEQRDEGGSKKRFLSCDLAADTVSFYESVLKTLQPA